MAKVQSILLQGLSGTIGKQLVFKKYGNKTVVSQYPDMTKVVRSERQKEGQAVFAKAVAYARSINQNPEQKAMYQKKLKKGQNVYQYALKEYLAEKKTQRQPAR